MTTHRRYYFEHPGPWTTGGHDKLLRRLKHACEIYWWFNEPVVEGAPFDRLSFSLTVSGRDQWMVHQRALNLAMACYAEVFNLGKHQVPEPLWEALEPHSNRGRWRLPTPSV